MDKHTHPSESCLAMQLPWRPSTDSKENAISKTTFLFKDCCQGQFTSHTHTNSVSLPHIRVCFYRFKLKPMEKTIEQVHILTTLRIFFMSHMFLKTNNKPLNNKPNDSFPNYVGTYWQIAKDRRNVFGHITYHSIHAQYYHKSI